MWADKQPFMAAIGSVEAKYYDQEFGPIKNSILSRIRSYQEFDPICLFVMDSTANYNILLGRDRIHANWCVSSSLYQFLLFWNGDEVEVVWADKQPFMAAIGSVEAKYYDQELCPIKFTSRRKDKVPRKAYMDSNGYVEIQKEAAKLLKVTTIVPYRPMSVQSSRRSIMIDYSQEEKAVAATALLKMKVQQTVERIKEEHF